MCVFSNPAFFSVIPFADELREVHLMANDRDEKARKAIQVANIILERNGELLQKNFELENEMEEIESYCHHLTDTNNTLNVSFILLYSLPCLGT